MTRLGIETGVVRAELHVAARLVANLPDQLPGGDCQAGIREQGPRRARRRQPYLSRADAVGPPPEMSGAGVVVEPDAGGDVEREQSHPGGDPHVRRLEVTVERVVVAARQVAEVQARQRAAQRSEEHTSELQSRLHLVCRLLLEK